MDFFFPSFKDTAGCPQALREAPLFLGLPVHFLSALAKGLLAPASPPTSPGSSVLLPVASPSRPWTPWRYCPESLGTQARVYSQHWETALNSASGSRGLAVRRPCYLQAK